MSLNVNDIKDQGGSFLKQQVVQVVNGTDNTMSTGTTAIPNDDTIPQNTEGNEVITQAITPKNASNILKIEVNVPISSSAAGYNAAALFKDSDADAIAINGKYIDSGSTGAVHQITISHIMTAGTTSAITFKVRAGANTGTITFNGYGGGRRWGGALALSITITEYQPSS